MEQPYSILHPPPSILLSPVARVFCLFRRSWKPPGNSEGPLLLEPPPQAQVGLLI